MSMRGHITFFLFALSLSVIASFAEAAPKRPLVVIPGVLGSKLVDAQTGEAVWPPIDVHRVFRQITEPTIQNYTGPVALNALRATCNQLRKHLPELELESDRREDLLPDGIILELIPGQDWIFGFYRGLVEFLESIGYTNENDLFVFDYDWRRSNLDTARQLETFLDEKLPDAKFDVLAHSMGGLIAAIYVDTLDHKRQVARVFTLGTPYSGSLAALKVILAGPSNIYYELPEWAIEWCLDLNHQDINKVVLSFPSLFELLPTYPQCCYLDNPPEPYQPLDLLAAADWFNIPWLHYSLKYSPVEEYIQRGLNGANRVRSLIETGATRDLPWVSILNDFFDTTDYRVYAKTPGPHRWIADLGDGTVVWESASTADSEIRQVHSEKTHHELFNDPCIQEWLRDALISDDAPGVAVGCAAGGGGAEDTILDRLKVIWGSGEVKREHRMTIARPWRGMRCSRASQTRM